MPRTLDFEGSIVRDVRLACQRMGLELRTSSDDLFWMLYDPVAEELLFTQPSIEEVYREIASKAARTLLCARQAHDSLSRLEIACDVTRAGHVPQIVVASELPSRRTNHIELT